MRRCIALLLSLVLFAVLPAHAQKGSRSSGGRAHVSGHTTKSGKVAASAPRSPSPKTPAYRPRSTTPKSKVIAPTPRARDASGRLKRSASAKNAFERESGHPGGWKGHVVDHIVPLACGGSDSPSNMQWQTVEAAKAKDKVERRGCGR